jgi:hypothetical protein
MSRSRLQQLQPLRGLYTFRSGGRPDAPEFFRGSSDNRQAAERAVRRGRGVSKFVALSGVAWDLAFLS